MGANDYRFELTNYDFSNTHPDFMGAYDTNVNQPTYVASPYGAWLASSLNPTADTFSDWFRSKSGTNVAFDNPLVLEYQVDGSHK